MKGELHRHLQATLQKAWKEGALKQTSLGRVTEQSQGNAGAYLLGKKAGAMDLDQADAALRHIGSSLPDWLAGLPAREPTRTEAMARALAARPELVDFVEALLDVPPARLDAVLDPASALVRAATGRRITRSDVPLSQSTRAGSTKRGSKRRR